MSRTQASTLVGRSVDGVYRIDALLGQGAVGAVYRAIDERTGQVVAFKLWHANALDEQVRGRFLREAKALDTLRHPNIVDVFGHGIVDGVPYVALEYLEGQTLDDLISAGAPLDTALALDIMRQALAAIAFAHGHQVVHRDLKPENIYIARGARGEPIVKILDYGLAKFMAPSSDPTERSQLTMTGMVMGTPLYMPPEQAAGSSVDLPVDVYAMGCVLFEMLTGRPPFLGESHLELLAMHLRAPIPKLAEARPDARFVPELQALIDRALAKKQTERFPNAAALLEAVNALPAELLRPVSLPPPAPSASAQRTDATALGASDDARRKWGLRAAVFVGVAVMLALVLLR